MEEKIIFPKPYISVLSERISRKRILKESGSEILFDDYEVEERGTSCMLSNFTTNTQTQTDEIKIVRVAEKSTQTENELSTKVGTAKVIESKEYNATDSKASSKYYILTTDY